MRLPYGLDVSAPTSRDISDPVADCCPCGAWEAVSNACLDRQLLLRSPSAPFDDRGGALERYWRRCSHSGLCPKTEMVGPIKSSPGNHLPRLFTQNAGCHLSFVGAGAGRAFTGGSCVSMFFVAAAQALAEFG